MTRKKITPSIFFILGMIIIVFSLRLKLQYTGKAQKLLSYFQISSNQPLLRPKQESYEEWINEWKTKLPISATLKDSSTIRQTGLSQTSTYRIYIAHIEIQNQTDYYINTGNNLYIIETAQKNSQDSQRDNLLTVASGYFREPPPEDYSGVVEFRGMEVAEFIGNERSKFGLYDRDFYLRLTNWSENFFADETYELGNWQLTSLNNRAKGLGPLIVGPNLYPFGEFDEELEITFGSASPSKSLTINTNLELGKMVISNKLEKIFLISPEILITNKEDEIAIFRYIIGFKQANIEEDSSNEKQWIITEKMLLPMTAEALLPLITENNGPLWRRVFTTHWAVKYCTELASPVILSIISANGKENDALRAAAILALGTTKHTDGYQKIIGILEDESESLYTRSASIKALGKLCDKRATPLLISIVYDKKEPESIQAITALGRLGDNDARGPLIDILENNRNSELHSHIAYALIRLADNSVLERLYQIAQNSNAKGAIYAVKVIGGVGTNKARNILIQLLQLGPNNIRESAIQALCNQKVIEDKQEIKTILTQILEDSETNLRTVAVRALEKFGDESIHPVLVRALLKENYFSAIKAEVDALIGLGYKDLSSFPKIVTRLRDLEKSSRYQVERLLKDLSGEDFSPKYDSTNEELELDESINKWLQWWEKITGEKIKGKI